MRQGMCSDLLEISKDFHINVPAYLLIDLIVIQIGFSF